MSYALDKDGYFTVNGVRPKPIEQLPSKLGRRKGGSVPPIRQSKGAAANHSPEAGAAATVSLILPEPLELGSLGAKTVSGDMYVGIPGNLDVNQGEIGDCWLIAALKMLAIKRPGDLANTLLQNSATSITMTVLKNGLTMHLTIDNQFPKGPFDGFEYAYPKNASWYGLAVEKIWAWLRLYNGTTTPNSFASLNNGWSDEFWSPLGVASSTNAIVQPTAYTRWQAAMEAGEIVCICTKVTTTAGIEPDHMHGVLAINPDNTVVLLQPWGEDGTGTSTDGSNDGIFTVTQTQIYENFDYDNITEFGRPTAPFKDTYSTPVPVPVPVPVNLWPAKPTILSSVTATGVYDGANPYAEYDVEVPTAGKYTLTLNMIENSTTIPNVYNVDLNNVRVGAAYSAKTASNVIPISLQSGLQKIRIQGIAMCNFTLTSATLHA